MSYYVGEFWCGPREGELQAATSRDLVTLTAPPVPRYVAEPIPVADTITNRQQHWRLVMTRPGGTPQWVPREVLDRLIRLGGNSG